MTHFFILFLTCSVLIVSSVASFAPDTTVNSEWQYEDEDDSDTTLAPTRRMTTRKDTPTTRRTTTLKATTTPAPGCCRNSYDYCGRNINVNCTSGGSVSYFADSLYSCSFNKNPVYKSICQHGCHIGQSNEHDTCKPAPTTTAVPTRTGCCRNSFNYCGWNLPGSCTVEGISFESDSLYSCAINQAPALVRACQSGCGLTDTNDFCHTTAPKAYIPSGGTMLKGQIIFSDTNKTKFSLQPDGNLVLYRIGTGAGGRDVPVWSSGTHLLITKPVSLKVLPEGDVVMYDKLDVVLWRLGARGDKYTGTSLWVLDAHGGTICLAKNGNCVWSS